VSDWVTDWLNDCLTDWLTDWQTDWLTDWLIVNLKAIFATDWLGDWLSEVVQGLRWVMQGIHVLCLPDQHFVSYKIFSHFSTSILFNNDQTTMFQVLRRLGWEEYRSDNSDRGRPFLLHSSWTGRHLRTDHPLELPIGYAGIEIKLNFVHVHDFASTKQLYYFLATMYLDRECTVYSKTYLGQNHSA